MMDEPCPLCAAADPSLFHRDGRRHYLRCRACMLVFVPSGQRLGRDAELREYEQHENDAYDPGYRRFLARLADPLKERLPPGSWGLDFGCGPAPALARLLEESGHSVALHDSFFCPNEEGLKGPHDFITATEVVEHLHAPGTVLQALWQALRPGGHLGIMTKLVRDQAAFATWHYIRDPTHVCFFSRETWSWWARRNDGQLAIIGSDVMIIQKSDAQ